MAEDLAAWGAPAELQARFDGYDEDDLFAVDPRGWDTLLLFLAVRTQWVCAPSGRVMGLNYPGVDVVIRRLRLNVTPQQFTHLQTMERAALREINDD